ncbi:hypothetical protein ACQ4PT_052400 [Festuca glaucescens]
MVYVAVAAAALLVLLPRPLGAVAGSTGNCTRHCGNISIPYPFGVEPGCYLDGFNLTCNRSHHQPRLFLGDGTIQVLEISIPNATVRVNSARVDILLGIKGANRTWGAGLGYAGPYFLSEDQNCLLTFGCNVLATLLEDGRLVGSCVALCPDYAPTSVAPAPTAAAHTYRNDVSPHDICSGGYCCHANLNPFSGAPPYGLQLHPTADAFSTNTGTSTCAYIVHVDYRFPRPVVMDECDALPPVVPAMLHWLAMGLLPASVATAFANKPVLILKLLGIFVSALMATKATLTSSMAATMELICLQAHCGLIIHLKKLLWDRRNGVERDGYASLSEDKK